MVHPWMAERLAEEHRRRLSELGPRSAPGNTLAGLAPTILEATMPTTAGRAVWHPGIRCHVGAWLIRAGVRLGGASVRTS
jgi:hypothetical protein